LHFEILAEIELEQDSEDFEDKQPGFWVHMIRHAQDNMLELPQMDLRRKSARDSMVAIPMCFVNKKIKHKK
jgi:hypothetical protein